MDFVNYFMETFIKLTRISCCVCGTHFAISEVQYEYLKEQGGDFWCPNGHILHFGESTVAKLRREITMLQKRLAEADEEITLQKHVIITKTEKFQEPNE